MICSDKVTVCPACGTPRGMVRAPWICQGQLIKQHDK